MTLLQRVLTELDQIEERVKEVEERGRDVLLHTESHDSSDGIHTTVRTLAESVQSLRQQAEDNIKQLQVKPDCLWSVSKQVLW